MESSVLTNRARLRRRRVGERPQVARRVFARTCGATERHDAGPAPDRKNIRKNFDKIDGRQSGRPAAAI